jgi:twitching motility protein PilT
MKRQDLHKLIHGALSNNVSDIHLRSGEKPCFRMRGDLVSIKYETLTDQHLNQVCQLLIKDKSIHSKLETIKEFDGSYELEGVCRIRYNILRYQGRLGIIIRIINSQIPTIDDLRLPEGLKEISLASKGLILITGATGSGKSSTLAAMINHINENKAVHILTLEDPIEYIHTNKKAKITQREIGEDTNDFDVALRSALRQDPDIILIGEMRDSHTISTAIKAAETGHLVFGTVHTTDALTTIGRLIAMFGAEEQEGVRGRIADNLHAIVSQRLLKTIDGEGRVPAQEILLATPGVREAIADPEKIHDIYNYMRKGKNGGQMQTFEQHLISLYKEGIVSKEEAKAAATSPEDFERNLMFAEENH